MFYKIISGLIMSPSLGEEFIAYEKTLANRYKLQKMSVFLMAILVLINVMLSPLSKNTNTSQNSLLSSQISLPKTITLSSSTNIENETLKPSQEIIFKLSATNTGSNHQPIVLSNNISDILEYANITDTGEGVIQGDVIVWPEVVLLPGGSHEVFFSAVVLDSIPTLGRSSIDRNSYDCTISNDFGNRIDLNVECPIGKNVDIFTTSLPNIDVFLTTIILIILLFIMSISTYRTNILLKQLSFIRKNREDLYVKKEQ